MYMRALCERLNTRIAYANVVAPLRLGQLKLFSDQFKTPEPQFTLRSKWIFRNYFFPNNRNKNNDCRAPFLFVALSNRQTYKIPNRKRRRKKTTCNLFECIYTNHMNYGYRPWPRNADGVNKLTNRQFSHKTKRRKQQQQQKPWQRTQYAERR